jgi:outer membrane receptor protein involved in Fe transport
VATQTTGYSEVSSLFRRMKDDFVCGLNIWSDHLILPRSDSVLFQGYSYQTIGGFLQNTWKPSEKISIETGLRLDHHNRFGWFFLPRVAGIWKINKVFYTRAGYGWGYKAPNLLSPQNTDINYRQILPLDPALQSERSRGANIEFNYSGILDERFALTVNHAFFYTTIQSPLAMTLNMDGNYFLNNAAGPTLSRGTDTYVRGKIDRWEFYLGYTFSYAQNLKNSIQPFVILTPRMVREQKVIYFSLP